MSHLLLPLDFPFHPSQTGDQLKHLLYADLLALFLWWRILWHRRPIAFRQLWNSSTSARAWLSILLILKVWACNKIWQDQTSMDRCFANILRYCSDYNYCSPERQTWLPRLIQTWHWSISFQLSLVCHFRVCLLIDWSQCNSPLPF